MWGEWEGGRDDCNQSINQWRVEGRKEGWREGNLKVGGKVEERRERFNLCSLQCAAGLRL